MPEVLVPEAGRPGPGAVGLHGAHEDHYTVPDDEHPSALVEGDLVGRVGTTRAGVRQPNADEVLVLGPVGGGDFGSRRTRDELRDRRAVGQHDLQPQAGVGLQDEDVVIVGKVAGSELLPVAFRGGGQRALPELVDGDVVGVDGGIRDVDQAKSVRLRVEQQDEGTRPAISAEADGAFLFAAGVRVEQLGLPAVVVPPVEREASAGEGDDRLERLALQGDLHDQSVLGAFRCHALHGQGHASRLEHLREEQLVVALGAVDGERATGGHSGGLVHTVHPVVGRHVLPSFRVVALLCCRLSPLVGNVRVIALSRWAAACAAH